MRVVVPITITDSILTSSTVAEPSIGIDPAAWAAMTTYVEGNKVFRTTTHKIYEATTTIVGNVDNDAPEISLTRAIPKWVEVSSTNKWQMFDSLRSTPTLPATTSITVTLTPAQLIDSIGLIGLSNVYTLQITGVDGGSVTRYNYYTNTIFRYSNGWYNYFFGGFANTASIVRLDIPTNFGNLVFTVTMTGSSAMSIGNLVLGNSYSIGRLQLGGTVDAINFSSIDRDDFGGTTLIPRRSVPKTSQKVYLDKSLLSNATMLKNTLNATTALWVGIEDQEHPYFEAYLIFGFYRDFTFEVDNPIGPMISLELEEI